MFLMQPKEMIRGATLSLILEKCSPADKKTGFVPAYLFSIMINDSSLKIGHLHIRLEVTQDIELYSGQIGYEVDPDFRGSNYAYKACLLVTGLLMRHGFSHIFITCSPDNTPSKKIIEKLGAQFIETVDVPKDKQERQHGSSKNRYLWDINDRTSER